MFKIKFTAIMAIVMMLAFSLFCPGNSDAVEIESMQGKQSVSVFGNLTNSDNATTTLLGGSYGMFFTDNMEGTGTLMLMNFDGDFTIYLLYGRFNYNFVKAGATYIPYVGCALGMVGYDDGDADDSAISIGAQGGVKYFLSEDTSFNLEASYTFAEIDSESYNAFSITAGISFYFGD